VSLKIRHLTKKKATMKNPCLSAVVFYLSACLCSCTTSKTTIDDHSYTYFYQHQAAPPRQVEETVTTNSTRTRRYQAPDERGVRDGDSLSLSDAEVAQGLGSDPLLPLERGNR